MSQGETSELLGKSSNWVLLTLSVSIVGLYFSGFFVSDDARISFSVAENLFNGNGPVYTAGERVMVHTNPLWTSLMAIGRFFSGDYGYISSFFSLLCLSWILFLFWRLCGDVSMYLLVLAYFFASKVLFAFMGAGLENPLSYALVLTAAHFFLKERWNIFILFAALTMICRLDLALLLLPGIAYCWFRMGLVRGLRVGAVYGMPFFLFMLLTLIYYGFAFPNTYYAKTAGLTFSLGDYFDAALGYYFGAIQRAPLGLLTLGLAGGLAVTKRIDATAKCLALGALLGAGYIFKVGGDQMFPRLLGAPVALSLFTIVSAARHFLEGRVRVGIISALILYGLFFPWAPLGTIDHIEKISRGDAHYNHDKFVNGSYVGDEQVRWGRRSRVVANVGEASRNRPGRLWSPALAPNHLTPEILLRDPRREVPVEVVYAFAPLAGHPALLYGARLKNFDDLGLADPLLSRLPQVASWFTPGHNFRFIPLGYPETVITGANVIEDPGLKEYYERLRNVTTGDLFRVSRLIDILKFSIGSYDHLIEGYPRSAGLGRKAYIKRLLANPELSFKRCSEYPEFSYFIVCHPDEEEPSGGDSDPATAPVKKH